MGDLLSRVSAAFSHVIRSTPLRARMAQTADDDTGWRRATDRLGASDDMVGYTMDVQGRERILDVGRKILRKNPFLYADYMEPMAACVVGMDGVKLVPKDSSNDTLKKELERFMERNAMDALFQMALESLLEVEGELVLPIRVDEGGNLSFTYVHTDRVNVEWSPDDMRVANSLEYTVSSPQGEKAATKTFVPIMDVTDKDRVMAGLMGKYKAPKEGDVGVEVPRKIDNAAVYVRMNYITTRRGLPGIFTMVDIADEMDQFVYRRLQLLEAAMRMWLDVSVTGGEKDVLNVANEYATIPDSGTADVHSATVVVEPKRFSLDGTEVGNDWNTVKEAWDLTTLFPSEVLQGKKPIEAGSMLFKKILMRQALLRTAVKMLVDCHISAKKAAGVFTDKTDVEYDIIFPEVSTKDVQKLATAANQIGLSLMVGVQEEFIKRETAAKAYAETMSMVMDTRIEANTEFSPEEPAVPGLVDPVTGKPVPPKGIQPQGGGAQGGQNPFDKFTKQGQQINLLTRQKVTR